MMVHKKYYKIWDGDLARLADSGKKKKKGKWPNIITSIKAYNFSKKGKKVVHLKISN